MSTPLRVVVWRTGTGGRHTVVGVDPMMEQLTTQTPLHRIGEPEGVAGAGAQA